ncbi:unnamed protein product [Arabidopsis arenosa]|uniref:DC1 domain-containing protein n=1 Tax=Arabidopsis arenosa TaxID=38785 RepID=A0A8S2A4E5_ARAAE|nr:unnamed protein product [Arabidopsis arenosa]
MGSGKTRAKPTNRPSVRHPSHNHPLRVFKSKEEDEIICSGCERDLIGEAFKCTKSECDYFLHKSCFNLPDEIYHKSHTNHPLTLLHSPPNGLSTYTCDACGEYGSAFTYHCSECKYHVHVGCAFVPENVEREDHEHPLTLLYNTPCKGRKDGVMFICDVCEVDMSENLWVYYCKECDYGTHVHSCATYEDNEPKKGEEEEGESSSSSASRIKSLMEAEKEMREMAIIHQLQLDALDAAGSYVGSWEPRRKYYW